MLVKKGQPERTLLTIIDEAEAYAGAIKALDKALDAIYAAKPDLAITGGKGKSTAADVALFFKTTAPKPGLDNWHKAWDRLMEIKGTMGNTHVDQDPKSDHVIFTTYSALGVIKAKMPGHTIYAKPYTQEEMLVHLNLNMLTP